MKKEEKGVRDRSVLIDWQGVSFPKLHLCVHLGFHTTLWAPNIVPLSPNRYFFKHAMLLAHKLINRHNILLTKNSSTYLLLSLFITLKFI